MPLRFPRLPDKDQLGEKLVNYPVLNSLLRMLLYERLFRFAFIGLLLLLCGTGIFVAKIITASPKGFTPPIKISGLDYVQAWSLRRTAVKQAAAGKFDDALYSWRVAIANNPVDPELLRGCLNHTLQSSDKRKCLPVVVGYSRWLMRLTETNLVDVELSATLYEHFDLDDLTIVTLKPLDKRLTPKLEEYYLRALFNRSRYTEFADRWKDAQLRGMSVAEPRLQLYQCAYDAGWGQLSEAAAGRKQLDEAKGDPSRRVLAHRLQLKVSEHLVQPDVYHASLQFLQDLHQDRMEDHVGYWELLNSIGRKTEALKQLETHVTPPNSGEEAVLLAKANYDLGNQDKSREILERYAPDFADSEGVWLSYANLLTAQKRWSDLKQVALLLRSENHPLRDSFAGYSYYLEGLAQLGEEQRERASSAFKKIPGAKVKNPVWELMIGEKLASLGFAAESRDVLMTVEKENANNPGFWLLLSRTAFDAKDPEVLVSALASAYKLRPDDPMIMNNYAAALISTRQRPEESLRLTSSLVEKFPDAAPPRLNHALALLQNQRLTEAESVLGSMDSTKLAPPDLSSYHLAVFELKVAQQRLEEAKQASDKIDAQFLLPTEKQWLEKTRRQLEPAAPAKS